MLRLFFFYAISGFISLGYQVAWFRIFTDWFGSTNLTFALVVCCFIGGLGLGALWSRPIVDWLGKLVGLKSRLHLYGLIELLVAATAILTLVMGFLPADLWGGFPYHQVEGVFVKDASYQVGQVLIAIVCVLVPCLFMGITFPLLCSAFLGVSGGSRLPAALYAFNTLGACSGVLVMQFWLLPLIGHSAAFLLMVGLNIAIGVYFLIAGGGKWLTKTVTSADLPAPVSVKAIDDESSFVASTGTTLLFTASILGGLVSGALEGDMFKRISLVVANNPGATMPAISFWAILGIFLGSTLVRGLPRLRLSHIKFAYLLALICYWLAWYFGYPVVNSIETELSNMRLAETLDATPAIAMFPESMVQLFLFVGVYVFPAYFLVSILLPWVCNHLQADQKHLGLAYGLNTLAFCLGMIGFTLIAPMVSIFYSLKLIFVLLICGALLLQLMQEGRALEKWKPISAIGFFAIAAYYVPGDFDRTYVNPEYPAAKLPVTAMKSNGAVTSFVVSQGGSKVLWFGNQSMSGTTALGQTYMRLMAHFPLLAQRAPKKALLICFGVGNTASAIAKHKTISEIDIVDLNKKVFETAPEFSDTNGKVYLDPRVRLINDDGRSYLSLSDQTYDLITSEPPPPMAAGIYRLYSREYYQDIVAHLTPTGMMSQWLPYYQMPPEAVAKAIGSFIEVFPHTLLLSGYAEELILVGSQQPIDLRAIRERFSEMPLVTEDLKNIFIEEPGDIYVRIMQTGKELRENYGAAGVISDENNHLEQMFPGWGRIPAISYDPIRVVDEVGREFPGVASEMGPLVRNLARIHFRVPDFPLYDVRSDPRVKYSQVDWSRVTRLKRAGEELLGRGNTSGAIDSFLKALKIVPEHGLLLSFVGQLYSQANQPGDAEVAFRRLVDLEPSNASVWAWLAQAIAQQGRGREAIEMFRRSLDINPELQDAVQGLAWILVTHPDPQVRSESEGLDLAEKSNLIAKGRSTKALSTLAAAYSANNRFDEAIEVSNTGLALARSNKDGFTGAKIRRELLLYQEGIPVIDWSFVR